MRILALLAALLLAIPGAAYAQSTAGPVVTGYLDANGRFVQYGAGGGSSGNVNVTGINGVAPDVGAGVTDTGSQRDTVAQDTTTIAGSAPGTAGTASAQVVTVQGITGGTPLPVAQTPSSSSTIGITPVVSASLEGSHVLKASAGNLYAVYASNLTGGTVGNLLIINATSAPGDGAVTPLVCVPFDASGKAQAFYSPGPPAIFSTGIVAVISSAASCFTKTTGVLTGFISGMTQ
jgi:hypothetical protein